MLTLSVGDKGDDVKDMQEAQVLVQMVFLTQVQNAL